MRATRARNQIDKANKKTLIMDTATELFLNNSCTLPTASEVAKYSNMTKGNLYTYFKSREDLFYHILLDQYNEWFDQIKNLSNFSQHLDTKLFEGFYNNELLVHLCSAYHSQMKHLLNPLKREKLEEMVRRNLEILTIPISQASGRSKTEIQILLYSSISLIIGAYHFKYEFDTSYDSLRPEDIYLPRLKVMWSFF